MIRSGSSPSCRIVISDGDFELSSGDSDNFGLDETSSFVSETSQELDSESSEHECQDDASIQSLKSLSSMSSLKPQKVAPKGALQRITIPEKEEASAAEDYSSYISSYSSYLSKPKGKKNQGVQQFVQSQASLGDFIEDDDYEEEELNSEDRAFIVSSSSSAVPNDSITMYRLHDRSQPWRPFRVESNSDTTSE